MKTENTYTIKIFIKGKKKPFCEVEVPDRTYLRSLYELLNRPEEFIKFSQVIFRKSDFDYATIN